MSEQRGDQYRAIYDTVGVVWHNTLQGEDVCFVVSVTQVPSSSSRSPLLADGRKEATDPGFHTSCLA
jgi:hypothetical protein